MSALRDEATRRQHRRMARGWGVVLWPEFASMQDVEAWAARLLAPYGTQDVEPYRLAVGGAFHG